MLNKAFIITVDTEGDNLWEYHKGNTIQVKNAAYIPRFQKLCEEFNFKPVYLVNYEMAKCRPFIRNARVWLQKNACEVGIHLHAWNNPPQFDIEGPYTGNPYLIEYPDFIMREKFKVVYNLIVNNFGITPVSHRAGRWSMDDRYFQILKDFGIKVDCSYTPGISWAKSLGVTIGGSDYSSYKNQVYYVNDVMEVPTTICKFKHISKGTFIHSLKSLLIGENVWLRPAICTLNSMKKVVDYCDQQKIGYLEFMIHSSELMPGGSIYFEKKDDIDKEYDTMRSFFEYVANKGYIGYTLQNFYNATMCL